jgi:hypothetical protein
MDEKVLKTLLKTEVEILVKGGMSIAEAVEKAGSKMKEELAKAEYETYCMEHDC